ncbi:hypothetical protein niasHT_002713 [Heterodera trifolii]|uniref:Uncharacterized protein n=1 Tax=Heterodera trifolii TaxID=157864 RepID=A0ABD2LPY7_9BILA
MVVQRFAKCPFSKQAKQYLRPVVTSGGTFMPWAAASLTKKLLLQRELPLSHEAYEPQLMAWLVYIYRTKCYAKTEGEEEDSTMAATDVAT